MGFQRITTTLSFPNIEFIVDTSYVFEYLRTERFPNLSPNPFIVGRTCKGIIFMAKIPETALESLFYCSSGDSIRFTIIQHSASLQAAIVEKWTKPEGAILHFDMEQDNDALSLHSALIVSIRKGLDAITE